MQAEAAGGGQALPAVMLATPLPTAAARPASAAARKGRATVGGGQLRLGPPPHEAGQGLLVAHGGRAHARRAASAAAGARGRSCRRGPGSWRARSRCGARGRCRTSPAGRARPGPRARATGRGPAARQQRRESARPAAGCPRGAAGSGGISISNVIRRKYRSWRKAPSATRWQRFWCVAEMRRKSLRTGRSAPTGRISPCSSTRSSFTCRARGMSATSSRKIVPPSACSSSPLRGWSAPVKAPRAWPNSSLSASVGLSEAMLTATKAPSARRL